MSGVYTQSGFLSPEQRAQDIYAELGIDKALARAISMQEDMDLRGLSDDLVFWQDVESVLLDIQTHMTEEA